MYADVCYQKSFLKQVIARIDFATPISQLEKAVPTKLLNAIVKNFPIVEPADMLMQEVALEGNSIKHSQTATKHWNYYSKDRERQLTIAPQHVFVVYTTYKKYEEIRDQFSAVIDALAKAFPETKSARFGLRYVNQIDLAIDDPTNWDQYVDKDLLSPRKFFGEEDPITRLITVVELKYDDMAVVFQFGMPNPDHPAQIRRPLFVLDLDASILQAHDLTEAIGYMDEGHSKIQEVFERSITEKLREKMNVKPIQQ